MYAIITYMRLNFTCGVLILFLQQCCGYYCRRETSFVTDIVSSTHKNCMLSCSYIASYLDCKFNTLHNVPGCTARNVATFIVRTICDGCSVGPGCTRYFKHTVIIIMLCSQLCAIYGTLCYIAMCLKSVLQPLAIPVRQLVIVAADGACLAICRFILKT